MVALDTQGNFKMVMEPVRGCVNGRIGYSTKTAEAKLTAERVGASCHVS